MKNLVLCTFLAIAAPLSMAQSDTANCPLDYDFYEAAAKKLATSKPGGRLDKETHEVSWADKKFGRLFVSIGGCNHFGLLVRAEFHSNRPLTPAKIIQYARSLVSDQFPKAHAKSIVPLLSKLERVRTDAEGYSAAAYNLDGYDEVSISYSFQNGVIKIEVSAIQTT